MAQKHLSLQHFASVYTHTGAAALDSLQRSAPRGAVPRCRANARPPGWVGFTNVVCGGISCQKGEKKLKKLKKTMIYLTPPSHFKRKLVFSMTFFVKLLEKGPFFLFFIIMVACFFCEKKKSPGSYRCSQLGSSSWPHKTWRFNKQNHWVEKLHLFCRHGFFCCNNFKWSMLCSFYTSWPNVQTLRNV